MTKWFERLVGVACLLFLGFTVYCVASHPSIILNRWRDSWSHIAAADEYLQSGVFAKDPFFAQAPPYATFGLMDALNAKLCRLTGASPETMFLRLHFCNVLMVAVAGFLIGYLLLRKFVAGLVSSVAVLVCCQVEYPFGSGFPFVTAASLFGLFTVCLWSLPPRHSEGPTVSASGSVLRNVVGNWPEVSPWGALWRGVFLGLLFDLHNFVGVFAVFIVLTTVLVDALGCLFSKCPESLGKSIAKAIILVGSFLAIAWPWLLMQWTLRGYLKSHNSHTFHMGNRLQYLQTLAAGVIVFIAHYLCKRTPFKQRLMPVPYAWLALTVLAMCIPFSAEVIGRYTAPDMADRIPLFFPFAVLSAYAYAQCSDLLGDGRQHRMAAICLLGVVILVATPLVYKRLRFCAGNLRMAQTTYRQHPYAYLSEELGSGWRGKVILSDPYTSFFARAFVGSYVLCAPTFQTSPAVDHEARYNLAGRALLAGPSQLRGAQVDGLVIDKGNHAMLLEDEFTRAFAEISADKVVDVWTNNGWRVKTETEHLILLCPSTR